MPADTDAFNESATPTIGMTTDVATSSHTESTPACSDPITIVVGTVSASSQSDEAPMG